MAAPARFAALLLLAIALALPAAAGDALPSAPVKRSDGGKWRIGYLEGGQYSDYETITAAIVRGLIKLGWAEPADVPREPSGVAGGLWRWLAANIRSDYVEFVADAYYAPGNFDSDRRPAVRAELLRRIARRGDLDLILAMGTWAGQDLAGAPIAVPVVVGSTSDPVKAGIIASAEDSGRDHVHAKVEPNRYHKQVALFHELIGFARLGVVYDDTPEGRTFAAIDAVQDVAAGRFQVVGCNAPIADLDQAQVEDRVVACYAQVAAQADAVYVTVHRGVTRTSLPRILAAVHRHQRPTFSMAGSAEVRRGVLMSLAQADFSYVGQFHAEVVAKILNGAAPRRIGQVWNAPPKIALNVKTAEIIGYDPPVDVLMASDEIYEEIEGITPAPARPPPRTGAR